MQNWLQANCPGEECVAPKTLPDLNPLDYHVWGAMLERYHELQPKPTTDELNATLQTIWRELPQEHINMAVANFTKCLTVYMAVAANGGHFEHLH